MSGRVVEEASAIGFARLFLVTTDKAAFYARLGWTTLESTQLFGLPAAIMVRELGD